MALSVLGKTAIVTGAGSGINLSFARLLLSKECNVLFADLALRPEAEELVSNHSSGSQSSPKAVFQRTDVREWQQLERMFQVADEQFGGADIVCPGAGVYEPPCSSFWYPPGAPPSRDGLLGSNASRYASLDINLTHPIRTTQLAMSHFMNPKHPGSRAPVSPSNPRSIIHISSIAQQVTPFLAPIYNATKHGLSGFVRSLAPLDKEIGIRVSAVAPGVIKTPLWTEAPEKLKLITPNDEWVTPEFVAEVMVDLIEREKVEVEAFPPPSTDLSSGDSRTGKKTIAVEGGLILEVAKGRVRKVEQFLDPGPSGAGNTVSNVGLADKEIFQRLNEGGWGC
ncbi:hypothetical protein MMC20_003315 [Loxospora ochrophaea]|nr:hypothetical protein [Loxospora ochrophaea]